LTHSFAFERQNNDNRVDKTSEKAENSYRIQTGNASCGVLGNFSPLSRIQLSDFPFFIDFDKFYANHYCEYQ